MASATHIHISKGFFGHMLIFVFVILRCSSSSDADVEAKCEKVCENYSQCQKINGTETCVCPSFCIAGQEPVCGDDGKNYTSECHLKVDACRSQKMIKVKHTGLCGSHNPCLMLKECENYAVCEVDSTGQPKCVCPTSCHKLYSPVCGSDGKTYHNECIMQQTSCQENRMITKKHQEVCEKPGLCPDVRVKCSVQIQLCSLDETCPGSHKCCPTTDCTLNCTKPWAAGNCDECSLNGTYCEMDDNSEVIHCAACPSHCNAESVDPKCASDKQTYANQCFFDKEKCHGNKDISVVYNGSCRRMQRHRSLVVGVSVGITTMIVCMLVVGGVLFYRHKKTKHGDEVLEVPFLDRDAM